MIWFLGYMPHSSHFFLQSLCMPCGVVMIWSHNDWKEVSLDAYPQALSGVFLLLWSFQSVLCLVAGYLILKCDSQGLVVSSPSLVHLQWFANFDPSCTWWHHASLLRSSCNFQEIFSVCGQLLPNWQSPGCFTICLPWYQEESRNILTLFRDSWNPKICPKVPISASSAWL